MDGALTIKGWGIADRGVGSGAIKKPKKLVRDKIPEIIKKEGKSYSSHRASASEYQKKLREKLSEEVYEYLKSGDSEELADIMEVVFALGIAQKISPIKLESLRKKKASERGAFTKRIILDDY